jgi:hypothetical protein
MRQESPSLSSAGRATRRELLTVDHGGRFAAMEEAGLLVGDIRDCFSRFR